MTTKYASTNTVDRERGAKVKIVYDMEFSTGARETIEVSFDEVSLILDRAIPKPAPAWTKLEFCQCKNCPVNLGSDQSCPLAVQLVPIAAQFGNTPSYENVILHVIAKARTTSARTTAQVALASLMGLIMPLSGCPVMAPLAPMARFHLPLSTQDETIYRVASMYFLSEFFSGNQRNNTVSKLRGLNQLYAGIQQVNQGISNRLRNSGAFAELNSIAILDIYAQVMPIVIEDALDELRPLFTRGSSL